MEPQNRKAEFEDAKAKAAEALAKGDPQAAIDQCVRSPYLHRAPPTGKSPARRRSPIR